MRGQLHNRLIPYANSEKTYFGRNNCLRNLHETNKFKFVGVRCILLTINVAVNNLKKLLLHFC